MRRLFPKRVKCYLIVNGEGIVPLLEYPKPIPGGYLTADGRRYVRGRYFVEMHLNEDTKHGITHWFMPRLPGRKTLFKMLRER